MATTLLRTRFFPYYPHIGNTPTTLFRNEYGGQAKHQNDPGRTSPRNQFAVSVDCVIFGYEDNVLNVLLIECDLPAFKGQWSLLGDLLRPEEDLDAAKRMGATMNFLDQNYY